MTKWEREYNIWNVTEMFENQIIDECFENVII